MFLKILHRTTNQDIVFSLLLFYFKVAISTKISGPLLPLPLISHSMVRLGNGQAILGGQSNIYSLTCSNRNWNISLLDRKLSVPTTRFVAIPIPDTISGCITGGKIFFSKIFQRIYTS